LERDIEAQCHPKKGSDEQDYETDMISAHITTEKFIHTYHEAGIKDKVAVLIIKDATLGQRVLDRDVC
jgi:hypothetical protein